MLILKATNVKHPGARGAAFWIDEHGKARYDERPSGKKRSHKYLAHVVFSDGTERYIEPKPEELDDQGQVVGGQPAIREIINRELFGEYGFKDGVFWQRKGALTEYKTRTASNGKVVVDPIQRHEGYTSFEFRDSSVARAYGGSEAGLPKKITQYKVEAKPHEAVPSKEKIELPEGATADKPPTIEELGIHNVPNRLPDNRTSIGEPLQSEEDPLAIADALLEAFLRARRPSTAKTPQGQAKARAERKDQFDAVVGKRKIEALPAWAVNKFDNAEHLQRELARDGEGRPITTLITLGIWNPESKSKRVREQLVREWTPFIRRWARRFGSVFASTDIHRKMEDVARKKQGVTAMLAENSANRYIRDRERDLFNEAVVVLLDEANKYMANDEPHGPYSRFDRKAENAIKNHLERVAKQAAVELGATALEDLHEEESYHAPKMISPKEHFELRVFEPRAKQIIKEEIANLPTHVRLAFESRLWMDDDDTHPEVSQERVHAERRARQENKVGRSASHWGRPWVGDDASIQSIATRLAHVDVKLRDGSVQPLGSLGETHQKYYLEKWYNEALAHLHDRLKNKHGGLTPDGVVVERWLRLEHKVAQMNRREIQERTSVPVAQVHLQMHTPSIEHVRTVQHPAVTFFSTPGSNRELAHKLGLADALDVPVQVKNVSAPRNVQHKLAQLSEHHKLIENLARIPNLGPLHEQASRAAAEAKNVGAWTTDASGNAQWHEDVGVVHLHNAAVKLHSTKGEDTAAVTAFTNAANAMGADHPMVKDYILRLKAGDVPTSADLASWRTRQHALYQQHQNRLHVIEFEQERRNATKSLRGSDLIKAFEACVDAYDELADAIFCKAVRIVKQPGSRGGVWYRNEQGEVVYGRQEPKTESSSLMQRTFDPREHQKQIDTHRYVENAHREHMKKIKEQMAELHGQREGAVPKQRAALNRKIATLQKKHGEHKEIVDAARAARVQAMKDMEAAKTEHAWSQKRSRADDRERAEQIRSEREENRGAIMMIGGHRMREDPETVRRESIMTIGEDPIAGAPEEPAPQPEPEPEPAPKGTTSLWRPGDENRRREHEVVSYAKKPKTQEEWNQEDKARRQKELDSYARQRSKYNAMTGKERDQNLQAQKDAAAQQRMHAAAAALPGGGITGEFDASPPVSDKPLPEAQAQPSRVRGSSLFARVKSSLKRVFGHDAPVGGGADTIAASLRGSESVRISNRTWKPKTRKRKRRAA